MLRRMDPGAACAREMGKEWSKYFLRSIYMVGIFLWEKWHDMQLERKGLRVIRNVQRHPASSFHQWLFKKAKKLLSVAA